ncbi:MAG: hypothetical protein K8953_12790, partial [Proteobacteria bacterium]|nr:hypothetical protein [Pseudomonadota bacterium]
MKGGGLFRPLFCEIRAGIDSRTKTNHTGKMKTTFTPEQLQNPETQRSNKILRACVHCGFCTATC